VVTLALDGLTKYSDACISGLIAAEKNKQSLVGLGIVKNLIDICRNGDETLKRAATACVASLSEQTEIPLELRQKAVLETLAEIIKKEENVEILDEAAFAIAQIAKDCRV
jgi:hypothetical protein